MSGHTRGPWRLVSDAQGPCMVMHPKLPGTAIASLTDTFKPVEGFVLIEAVGAPERTANAHLIAAAPDLLRELRIAVTSCRCSTAERISGHRWECFVPNADVAIAKAEGR